MYQHGALFFSSAGPGLSGQQVEKKAAPQGTDLPIENNQIKLGLKSTLMLGLKNNLDIAFQSYNPQIVRHRHRARRVSL